MNQNREKFLVVIAGHIGTGKTTVRQYLQEQGYASIEMGEYLKQIVKYSTTDRDDILKQIEEHIRKEGRDNVIKRLLDELTLKSTKSGYVISGVRTAKDMSLIIKHSTLPIIPVFIYAEQYLRYKRCLQRGRQDVSLTFDDFIKIDYIETLAGIARLFVKNNFVIIYNNKGKEYLYSQIEKILKYKGELFYEEV